MHPEQFLALHDERERRLVERLEAARGARPASPADVGSRLGARALWIAAVTAVGTATRRGHEALARRSSSRDALACCAAA